MASYILKSYFLFKVQTSSTNLIRAERTYHEVETRTPLPEPIRLNETQEIMRNQVEEIQRLQEVSNISDSETEGNNECTETEGNNEAVY